MSGKNEVKPLCKDGWKQIVVMPERAIYYVSLGSRYLNNIVFPEAKLTRIRHFLSVSYEHTLMG